MTKDLYGGARKFDTGATRDLATDKPDYEGALSPLVLASFTAYMIRATHMSDGTTRESDNWQKGIPIDVYVKSLLRHVIEIWIAHRRGEFNREASDGAFFNLQGFYHEHLKALEQRGSQAVPTIEPGTVNSEAPGGALHAPTERTAAEWEAYRIAEKKAGIRDLNNGHGDDTCLARRAPPTIKSEAAGDYKSLDYETWDRSNTSMWPPSENVAPLPSIEPRPMLRDEVVHGEPRHLTEMREIIQKKKS